LFLTACCTFETEKSSYQTISFCQRFNELISKSTDKKKFSFKDNIQYQE
jgi:hypothetical protein